jgi:hypothetical protein
MPTDPERGLVVRECGCWTSVPGIHGVHSRHCPLHAEAAYMLAALRAVVESGVTLDADTGRTVRLALRRATCDPCAAPFRRLAAKVRERMRARCPACP